MEGQIQHGCPQQTDTLAGPHVKGEVSAKDMLLTLEF